MQNATKHLLFLFLFLTIYQNGFSQKDTIFWFAAPEVSQVDVSNFADRPIYLRLSAYSTGAWVYISEPANSSFTQIKVYVNANSTYSVDLTSYLTSIENKPGDKILDYGLLIQSTAKITAYYHVVTKCDCNQEIYNLKGANALGTYFLIPSQNTYNNATRSAFTTYPPYSSFNIVATSDSTKVQINPTNDIVGHTAGTTFTITLNKGQSYAAIAKSQYASGHLGGSVVKSNKPIAVTISDDLLAISLNADLVGDQILPVDKIGREYIIPRGYLTATYEYAYIMAVKDSTHIYKFGTFLTKLDSGKTYSTNISAGTYIYADNPIYVLHVSGNVQELAEKNIPPLNCTGSNEVNFIRNTAHTCGLLIITRRGNENYFTLNGSKSSLISASKFAPVSGTSGNWMFASISNVPTTSIAVGSNTSIKNTRGVFHLGIIVGDDTYGSEYGYFADYGTGTTFIDTIFACSNDSFKLDAGESGTKYLWNDNSTGRYLMAKKPGRYYVKITTPTCTIIDSMTLYLKPPKLDLGKDTMICKGDTIILDPKLKNGKFQWQDNSTGLTFKAWKAGKYYLTVTTECGTQSDTINIGYHTTSINLGKDTSFCIGDTIFLNSKAPDAKLKWQDGSSSKVFKAYLPGKYYLTAQTACLTLTDTIILTAHTTKISLGKDTTFCLGDTVYLKPQAPDATFKWQDGSTSPVYKAYKAGRYIVNAKTICQTLSDTIFLDTHTTAINLGKDTTFCIGDTIQLNSGLKDATLKWQDGSNSNFYKAYKPGKYFLTAQTPCAILSDTIILSAHTNKIDLGKDTTFCLGDTIYLRTNAPDASIKWQDGSTSQTFKAFKPGKYFVTATTRCKKIADTIIVGIHSTSVFLGNDTILCPGSKIRISPKITDAKFTWQDGSHDSFYIADKPGKYYLTAQTQCKNLSDTLNITEINPAFSLGKDTVICLGSTILLAPKISQGKLVWQDKSVSNTFLVKKPGIYFATLTTVCGIGTDTIIVLPQFSPSHNAIDTISCGNQAFLHAKELASSYTWNTGDTTNTITVNKSGTYWVNYISQCRQVIDTIHLTLLNFHPEILPGDTELCSGDTLILDASNNYSDYLWNDSSTQSKISINKSGKYWVKVKQLQCESTDTINVNFNTAPVINLGNDTTFCGKELTLLLKERNAIKITWQDSSADTLFHVTQPGTYFVTVSNKCGTSSDTIKISMDDCGCDLNLGNVFSPNNDGFNEEYYPYGCDQPLDKFFFIIFNRWGERVFETDKLDNHWDGQFNSRPCAAGTYYYILRYEYKGKPEKTRTGTVTLVR